MKVLAYVLSLIAVVASRSAYRFSDGYLDILGGEPNQSFDCAGRPYGYYADIDNDCRVFHVCLPIPNDAGEVVDMAHFSFMCGNQTVFSQESLTCTRAEDALPCEESQNLYDISNSDFGRIFETDGNVELRSRSFETESETNDVNFNSIVEEEEELEVSEVEVTTAVPEDVDSESDE